MSLQAASTALPSVLSLGHPRQGILYLSLSCACCRQFLASGALAESRFEALQPSFGLTLSIAGAVGTNSRRFQLETVPSSHSPAQDTLSLLLGGFNQRI